ncbi:helix-turn-helix transcriptional regulator [Mycolicibacterium iranicum]|nr:helix-turn-helix transcriptional regulator [Mycolicibacterium iranicum]
MGSTKSAVVDRLAGNVLKLARLERGMTQRELAAVAGVAQSTIARIESGARQPSLPLMARVLAAIDLEMRISLAPYDAHDDVLDATEERLSGEELERRRENQDDFASALKEGAGRPVTPSICGR